MDIFKYADSIVVGVKFDPNFSYTDKHGEISQKILREIDAFRDVYKAVQKNQFVLKLVDNLQEPFSSTLTLSSSDIVFDDKITDYNDAINKSKIKLKAIIKHIIKEYEITSFLRVGLATRFIIDDTSISNTLFNNVFKINNIKYTRFAQTSPTKRAINKNYNDYYNTIFDFRQDKVSLNLSVDFQHIFDPKIKSIDDFKIEPFYKENKSIINNTVVGWMNNVNK